MNSTRDFSRKYNLSVNKHKIIGNRKILYTNKGIYSLKKKKRKDLNKIFDYLKAKQFNNILENKSDELDSYEVTDYIEEINFPIEEKAQEAIYLLSILHNKTTFYKNISLDEVKCFYEEHIEKINGVRNHIDNLCHLYDEDLFLSPSRYLFLRNITLSA